MTEKRFVPIGVEWTDGFIQDHIGDKDLYNVNKVCDLLNKSYEETKELKEEIIQIEKNHDDFYDKVVFEINQSIQYFELKTGCHDETINELRRLKEVLTEWSV